jgi:hypothetical protein
MKKLILEDPETLKIMFRQEIARSPMFLIDFSYGYGRELFYQWVREKQG